MTGHTKSLHNDVMVGSPSKKGNAYAKHFAVLQKFNSSETSYLLGI